MRTILLVAAAVLSLSARAFAGNEQFPDNPQAHTVCAQQSNDNNDSELEPTFGARVANVGSEVLPLTANEALIASPGAAG